MKAKKIKRALLKAFCEGITLNQGYYDELLEELYQLEEDAELGCAVKRFLSVNESGFGPTMLLGDEDGDINLYTVEDILEWAKGV
jgi:hypothetical protein